MCELPFVGAGEHEEGASVEQALEDCKQFNLELHCRHCQTRSPSHTSCVRTAEAEQNMRKG